MAQILEVKTMQDVYGAFYDFSRTLAAKVYLLPILGISVALFVL
jgi:hypothetical protein